PPLYRFMKLKKQTKLSDFTTIKLGGEAKEFVECKSIDEIKEALLYAKEKNLDTWVLAGGSNTIFSDEGFDGLVIKIDLQGVEYDDKGGYVFVSASAGENWDDLVEECVKKGLAGIEALSGIPGSVGATPIQNVGAYGQEVGDVVEKVKVLDKQTLKEKEFSAQECKFGYRTSRFKEEDKEKYIIIEVVYRLIKNKNPQLGYPELEKQVKEKFGNKATLSDARELVLELRRGKSMVIDKRDPNSVSSGSFFTNPILSHKQFEALQNRNKSRKGFEEVPFYEIKGNNVKVPAAWLIEQAGFTKGYQKGKAAISENHCLALVNHGGTTYDIMRLAGEIQYKVKEKFGIELECEPSLVG
ncbi:UDP-N-acetylmuramate dehydrogenase, partial [Patescibacteria group bacterium]|nr:UDP-N-acetylmuramate dehydrogenase [Patescibacteria group bacterium]